MQHTFVECRKRRRAGVQEYAAEAMAAALTELEEQRKECEDHLAQFHMANEQAPPNFSPQLAPPIWPQVRVQKNLLLELAGAIKALGSQEEDKEPPPAPPPVTMGVRRRDFADFSKRRQHVETVMVKVADCGIESMGCGVGMRIWNAVLGCGSEVQAHAPKFTSSLCERWREWNPVVWHLAFTPRDASTLRHTTHTQRSGIPSQSAQRDPIAISAVGSRVGSHHVGSHRVGSHHIPRHQVTSHHIPPHPTTSHHIPPHPARSHHIPPHPARSHAGCVSSLTRHGIGSAGQFRSGGEDTLVGCDPRSGSLLLIDRGDALHVL